MEVETWRHCPGEASIPDPQLSSEAALSIYSRSRTTYHKTERSIDHGSQKSLYQQTPKARAHPCEADTVKICTGHRCSDRWKGHVHQDGDAMCLWCGHVFRAGLHSVCGTYFLVLRADLSAGASIQRTGQSTIYGSQRKVYALLP